MRERSRSSVQRPTYVAVSHHQRSFRVPGLELEQLLQGGGGHPAHPLPAKGERLRVGGLRHQLGERVQNAVNEGPEGPLCEGRPTTHYQLGGEDELLGRVQGKKLFFVKQPGLLLLHRTYERNDVRAEEEEKEQVTEHRS